VQSSSQITTINVPTLKFFTGQMSFLSTNQQCQSIDGSLRLNGHFSRWTWVSQFYWS